ncbi:MAG TPA: DUF72 domain-containing protein [Terriglobales bacterium]|nr:DUF72 domain-containing protein [Terriglobales bacterium]
MTSANVHVGTSGWGYPTWKPAFYPKEVKQKDFLRYYASQLNAVEVNYTFRHMVSEKSVTSWLQETPEDFRFAIKAHQTITHIKRLKNAEEPVQRFVESLKTLDASGRLGPALFQLPPNLKCDVGVLRDFLALLPPKMKATFEFRNASWFADEVYKTLADRDAALCIAEDEERETPDVATASFRYYRLRKPGYTADELAAKSKMLREAAEKSEVYAFFKHEEDPQSAVWAVEVLKQGQP